MKTSIIYSGIILALFVNFGTTSFGIKNDDKAYRLISNKEVTNNKSEISVSDTVPSKQKKRGTVKPSTALNAQKLLSIKFEKPIANVIAERNELIEITFSFPMQKKIEYLIREDNAITENNLSNEIQPLDFELIYNDLTENEIIESVAPAGIEKANEDVFAEDNAITDNNLSNQIQPLDFELINSNSFENEIIESVFKTPIEETIEEVIAQDNAITENNFSNETLPLDFEKINRNSILVK